MKLDVAADLTGAGLSRQLLTTLRHLGIDTSFMVGQAYDGAPAMSGEKNGVQKRVKKECPLAIYTHCAFHRLNLCLLKACNIREVQAAVTVMKDISTFFGHSAKRLDRLYHHISIHCPESSHSRLKKYCCTRWVENQEAVLVFKELYDAVVASLDEIADSGDSEVVGKATAFMKGIADPAFLISLEVLTTVLNVTKPLSKTLQSTQETIVGALNSINSCKGVLQDYRDDEAIFKQLFTQAQDLYGDTNPMPRVSTRQLHRSNPPAANAEVRSYSTNAQYSYRSSTLFCSNSMNVSPMRRSIV